MSTIARVLAGFASIFAAASLTLAQQIDPSKGADESVEYAALVEIGPWDDRNYALTAADLALLAPNERDLNVAVPAFFRVELRRRYPGMLRSGPVQYPHSALLAFMRAHGGYRIDGKYYSSASREGGRWRVDLHDPFMLDTEDGPRLPTGDIEVTSFARESTIAHSPIDKSRAVAGTIVWPGPPVRQEMFFTTDGGASWEASAPLPLEGALGDPTVAWSADGAFAYTASLSPQIDPLYFYRSADGGQTWTDLQNEPGADPRREIGTAADKEYLHVDHSPTSPFKDNIYLTWENVNNFRMAFGRSTDFGHTWTTREFADAPAGLAGDVTTDANGTIYYAWNAFLDEGIALLRSADGGDSFLPATTVASTNLTDTFWLFIPAQPSRGALSYVSADTDRTDGPFAGSVYLAWTDAVTPAAENARIQVGHSRDGGESWTVTAPHPVTDQLQVDRFHQWLEVDDDGRVHAVFYSTRGDPSKTSVNLLHTVSEDGGATWSVPVRLTSQRSPAASDGFAFGDYNGLSITDDQLTAIYSDNRDLSVDTWSAGKVLAEPPVFTLLPTDPGIAGQANDFTTVNGNPGTPVVVYRGLNPGSTPVTIGSCSTIIDLANTRVLGFGPADATGSATITREIPDGAAGRSIGFQAIDVQPCETSNVEITTFQ